jgi:hypothetical protein
MLNRLFWLDILFLFLFFFLIRIVMLIGLDHQSLRMRSETLKNTPEVLVVLTR